MSKDKKPVAAKSDTTQSEKWTTKTIKKLTPVVDWTLKGIATVFVLATSFCFVRDWLQTNQVNRDFSLVGAILVMSVALYLIVRKR